MESFVWRGGSPRNRRREFQKTRASALDNIENRERNYRFQGRYYEGYDRATQCFSLLFLRDPIAAE